MLTAWRSIRSLPRWLQFVLLGVFVNFAAAFATMFITLYVVQSRHASSGTAGLVSAALGAGLVLGNLVGGSLGDRFGLRRTLVAALALWAAGCVAVPATSLGFIAPVLFFAGLGGGAARPLTGAVVLSASAVERKREGAAAYRVVINAAIAIGPPVAGLLSGRHFGLLFVLDGTSSLVLALLVWRFAPAAEGRGGGLEPDVPRLRLWRALRVEPVVLGVLFSIMLVDTSYRQLFVTYPLELHRLGVPNVVYGLLVALNCVVIVLFEVPLAVRLAHRQASVVISSGYLLVGLGWLVFGVHPVVVTAAVAMLITTFGEMLYKPNAMASVAAAAPAGFEGRFQSMYAGASVAGLVFGPAVGGWVYGIARPAVWFGAAALAVVGAAVLTGLTGKRVVQITSTAGT